MKGTLRDGSVKRGARDEKVECAEEKVREKSVTKVEADSMHDRDILRIVWNNVWKIRMRKNSWSWKNG